MLGILDPQVAFGIDLACYAAGRQGEADRIREAAQAGALFPVVVVGG